MKTGVLVYDTCAQFEVVFAALILKDKGEVTGGGDHIWAGNARS
ncbi:MAG TPA: hypothetical protein VGK23_12685 [Methanomassiliicoccales archaeon]